MSESNNRVKQMSSNIIRTIQNLLRDSYTYNGGFTILKELIQNANDAHSPNLKLRFNDGISDATHPLLRLPAILIYDDGDFNEGNEIGIADIAGENKTDDDTKIGRYGLGMKSVFHLCDLFFYAAFVEKKDADSEFVIGAVNPWKEDVRPEYAKFEDNDVKLFEKAIPSECFESKKGFLLWLPAKEIKPEIQNYNISEQKVDAENPFGEPVLLKNQFSYIISLLSEVSPRKPSIECISYKHDKDSIEVKLAENTPNTVECVFNKKLEKSQFHVYKAALSETAAKNFEELKACKYWDKGNKDTEPEVSFLLMKTPKNDANRLSNAQFNFCVYLPLEEPAINSLEVDLDEDYTFLIHANFSVDAGRKGPKGYDDRAFEKSIRPFDELYNYIDTQIEWNKLIVQQVLLPSIPLFFDELVKSGFIDTLHCEKLLKTFFSFVVEKCSLRNVHLTSSFGFAKFYELEKKGFVKEYSAINLENDKYIYLPNVEDKYLPEIFENIQNFPSRLICNCEDDNFILPEYHPEINDLNLLIDSIYENVLSKKEYIKVLTAFFRINKDIIRDNEETSQKIIDKLKKALHFLEFNDIYANREELKDLFIQLNYVFGPSSYFKICSVASKGKTSEGIDSNDYYNFWEKESRFIFVPGFIEIPKLSLRDELNGELYKSFLMYGEESPCAFFSKNDDINGFKHYLFLAGILVSNKEITEDIAFEMISSYENLCVFEATPVTERGHAFHFSLQQLQHMSSLNCLYSRGLDYVRSDNVVAVKARFMPHVPDYYLTKRLCAALNDKGVETKEPNATNVIYSILNTDKQYEDQYYDLTFLNDFLKVILGKCQISTKEEFRLIKFFLGNCKKEYIGEDLYRFDTTCHAAWKKIFEKVKPDAIYIDGFEGRDVNSFIENNRTNLSIQPLTNRKVLNELYEYEKLNKLDFFKEDSYYHDEAIQEVIFKEFSIDDKSLYLKIPLHRNSANNEFISADENTYLNTEEIRFPDNFKFTSKIINLNSNPILKEKQEILFDDKRKLTHRTAIDILFSQGQFSKIDYSDWIFEQIKSTPNVDFMSAGELGLNTWIPVKGISKFTSLRQIIPNGLNISSDIRKMLENGFEMVSEYDLEIIDSNREVLDRKLLSKVNIDSFLEELTYFVSKKIYERPFFNDIEDMMQQCNVYKDFKAEPLYKLLYLFSNDASIGKSRVYEHLYKKLNVTGVATYQNTIQKLNYITDYTSPAEEKSIIIYKSILEKLLRDYRNEFSFSDIKLPVKSKKYKNAADIAASNSKNISDDFVCIDSVYSLIMELIGNSIDKVSENKDEEKLDSDKPALRDDSDIELINKTFDPWFRNLKQSKLLYLFFYLLKENFKKIALEKLEHKELEVLLDDFPFTRMRDDRNDWIAGYTKKEAFEDTGCHGIYRVRIYLPTDGEMTVHSLTGEMLTVDLKSSDNNESLSIEDYYSSYTNEYKIKLAKISGETKDLDGKLQDLITNVLHHAYFQHDDEAIQKMLKNFTHSDQITIQAAQNEIFDHIDYILKEYSVRNDLFKTLKQELKNLSAQESKGNISHDERIAQKEELIQKFIETIKEDEIFQEEIHDAVVRKIREQQYNEASILFELLQNADDSINDLVLCKQDVSKRRMVEIHTVDNAKTRRIYFSHFGRLINKQYSNLDIAEELKEKFAGDLQNMLSLNFSDKLDGNDTGKFGLGFKSIYLACLNPIVRSGELCFEIKGALYPMNYELDQYDRKLDMTETSIGLRLKKDVEIETIMKSFRKLAAIQTLFCKQVNEIKIDGHSYGKQIIRQNEYGSDSISQILCGDYQFIVFAGKCGKQNYSICFMLNEEGKLYAMTESDLVKVWNVTPLENCEAEKKLPFIINGDFQVDTGRKQLSGDTRNNIVLLNKISRLFVHTLVEAKKDKDSIVTDELFDGILDILLTTANVQSEIFREFGRECLSSVKNETGLIPNGDGKSIPYNSQIYYFAPNSFGFESSADKQISEFFNSLEDAFKAAGKNAKLVLRTVYECFRGEGATWQQINKIDGIIFQIWPNKDLSNDVISKFIRIVETLPKTPKINTDWSYYRLKNNCEKWNSITSYHFNDIHIETLLPDYAKSVIKFLRDNISVAASQGTSQEENQSSDTTDETVPFNNIYDLWEEEENWNDKVNTYYGNLYPNALDFMNLKSELEITRSVDKDEIPEKWCLFMLTAICQSIPSYDHTDITNKKAIDTLYNDKIIKLFVEGKSLNEVYDAFLEKNKEVEQTNKYYERNIRQFEMLLRLYQIRKNFDLFHSLLSSLCERENPLKRISEFLVTWTDAELDGAGFDLTATDRTFKMGIHMMIRDLLRCGFWDGQDAKQIENLKKFAYMPKAVFKNYFGQDNISSEEIRQILEADYPNKEFLDCYDLPFLIYKKGL